MKIEVDVTGDNEATAYPWWAIVDPAQNMRADLAHAAGQITGPFFSRDEAEGFLKATRYNFSKRAKVWCFSGTYSYQYREAFRAAEKRQQEPVRYVYLPKAVRGDGPFRNTMAREGVYVAHVNPEGAVSVTAEDGKLLGVKPGEFVDAGGIIP